MFDWEQFLTKRCTVSRQHKNRRSCRLVQVNLQDIELKLGQRATFLTTAFDNNLSQLLEKRTVQKLFIFCSLRVDPSKGIGNLLSTGYEAGLTRIHLPMQNRLKISSSIDSVISSPVTSPSAWMAERRSIVQKSRGSSA